ncbi:MAG TPA: hypothetical protein VIC28_11605 [Thermoanaerobaculia bacterium]|jgi:hypothetical protein
MRTRPLFLLLLSLVAVPVFADDVYLTNGRKFEGVVAETTDSQVRIQMQGGTLSLPRSQVLRVESGDSSLAGYLQRRDALKKNPAASAAAWLELARWARAQGLGQASREAALAAAVLDPRLQGLAPILRGYGYVLDEQLDRWIPYEESMRRKGFVLSNGQWITREEYAVKLRALEAENAQRRADQEERARSARVDRLAALTELTLTRELTRPSAPVYPVYGNPLYGTPVVVIPGFWIPDGSMHHHQPKADPSQFTHIPGSLIPGNLVPPTAGH